MRIPEFRIDLNLPPEKRFEAMGITYRRRLGRLLLRVKKTVIKGSAPFSPVVAKAIPVAMAWCERELQRHEYFRELVGFAEAARAPVADLLLANIVYDLSAGFKIPMFGCTGLVHGGPESPLIARTMDWDQPEGIGRESAVIRYTNPRQGWDLLTVGFPGINGVISGMSSVGVAITVNQRTPEEAWIKLPNFATPTLWRVREVLENSTSYAGACRMIAREMMASPAFFLLCGPRPGEARLVLSDGKFQSHYAVPKGGTQAVSNHVPGGPPLLTDYEDASSMERSIAMSGRAARMKTADIRAAKTAISRWPVFCERTVHQMVLSPAEGALHLRCRALSTRYSVFGV